MEAWRRTLLLPLRAETLDGILWHEQSTGTYYALQTEQRLTGYRIEEESYLVEVGSSHPNNRERLTEVVFPV